MENKVDLKELAAAFGMKVNELADFLGYTRQALYQMNDGTNGVCTGRYHAALKLLTLQSDKLDEEDLKKAMELRKARERMIRQMGENVGGINILGKSRFRVETQD